MIVHDFDIFCSWNSSLKLYCWNVSANTIYKELQTCQITAEKAAGESEIVNGWFLSDQAYVDSTQVVKAFFVTMHIHVHV